MNTYIGKIVTTSIAGLAIVTVLSGCAQKGVESNAHTTVTQEASTTVTPASEVKSFTGTMRDLLAMGRPQTCEWNDKTSHGVTYMDGKHMRVDAISVDDGVSHTVSTINDGTWMYTWDTATKRGQKMSVATMERLAQKGAAEAQKMTENAPKKEERDVEDVLAMEGNYTCKRWSVDASLFTPPSDVVFEDMGAMLKKAREQAQGQCAQLPAAQRAMCEEAVGNMAF